MQNRAEKTRRVASVQAQIKRLEEWKLAELERRLAKSEEAQRETIAALNQDHPLHGLFIDVIARRLRTLTEEASRTRDIRDVQGRRLLACAGRSKSADRLAAAADRAEQRDIAKKELLELVETLAARRDASLP
jgi:hypothetical protein